MPRRSSGQDAGTEKFASEGVGGVRAGVAPGAAARQGDRGPGQDRFKGIKRLVEQAETSETSNGGGCQVRASLPGGEWRCGSLGRRRRRGGIWWRR